MYNSNKTHLNATLIVTNFIDSNLFVLKNSRFTIFHKKIQNKQKKLGG